MGRSSAAPVHEIADVRARCMGLGAV